jgi:thymidylate synthase ThyX
MIKVDLISHSNIAPLDLTSHAARVCYQAEPPEMGKNIDVENRLFNTGHHTTLQHFFFTFLIDGISVGDITLGMHLASPFYNSDQRSGRYCARMFLEPDFLKIENYIKAYWPEVNGSRLEEVMDYIKKGVGIYHENIEKASEISKEFLKEERPFISDKLLEANAPKIAQEQMRVFIPVIFPTGFDFTVNLTALVAMYRAAWTPVMKYVTGEMAKIVLNKFPELEFMFKEEERRGKEWSPELESQNESEIKYKPELKLLKISGEEGFIEPSPKDTHPVDLLHFLPETMKNQEGEIGAEIEISLATMGQDQRHRTIRRGEPKFTGNFYLPPIPRECGLEEKAKKLAFDWRNLYNKIPKTLFMILAPYGAMVNYKKFGTFNAVAHEQAKRLCWCAQEEIYHMGRSLRLAIEEKKGANSPLLRLFEPACFREGVCGEGARYCGRNIKLRDLGDYFPERRV